MQLPRDGPMSSIRLAAKAAERNYDVVHRSWMLWPLLQLSGPIRSCKVKTRSFCSLQEASRCTVFLSMNFSPGDGWSQVAISCDILEPSESLPLLRGSQWGRHFESC